MCYDTNRRRRGSPKEKDGGCTMQHKMNSEVSKGEIQAIMTYAQSLSEQDRLIFLRYLRELLQLQSEQAPVCDARD